MRLLFRFALGWFAGCVALAVHACPISIAYSDQASPPYYLGNGDAIPEHPGVAVELLNLAAAKMGCKIQWKRLPGRRALRELEGGSVDAMLLLSYNPERAAYAVYPMTAGAPDAALSLATLSYSVYVKSGSDLKWDGKQFGPVPALVGANSGYSVADELRKQGLSVEEAPSASSNLNKLLMGRITAYVGQDLQADSVIEDAPMANVQKLTVPFSSKDYYLPFSRRFFQASPLTAVQLWKQIADARKTYGKDLAKKYADAN
jgi:polar amino acid transport system substrate-binding protein